jgi:hypothetical protein
MFTISIDEITERVRLHISSTLKAPPLREFELISLHQDAAGGNNGPRSEYVIALVRYMEPVTEEVSHAGVLIDYINEWPLAVALEKDEMRISREDAYLINNFRGPFSNENGSYTVSQVRSHDGRTAVVLTNAHGGEYYAFDPRPQSATAV